MSTAASPSIVVAPAKDVYRLPPEIPLEAGSIIADAITTPFHAVVRRGKVVPGDWVLVLGCGGVGLNIVQLAAAIGARVIAVDMAADKLAWAGQARRGGRDRRREVRAPRQGGPQAHRRRRRRRRFRGDRQRQDPGAGVQLPEDRRPAGAGRLQPAADDAQLRPRHVPRDRGHRLARLPPGRLSRGSSSSPARERSRWPSSSPTASPSTASTTASTPCAPASPSARSSCRRLDASDSVG